MKPLPREVIEKYREIDDNLDYLALFWAMDELREWMVSLDEIPSEWKKVTYQQVKDYQDYLSNVVNTDAIFDKVYEEYYEIFPDHNDELMSLLSEWREKFEENDPSVPPRIAAYLRSGSSHDEADIIREYIDKDHIGILEYLQNYRYDMLRRYNPTVYEIFEAYTERE